MKTITKELKLIVYKETPFSVEDKKKLNSLSVRKCRSIDDIFAMKTLKGPQGYALLFFDVYDVESLSFSQRIRHKASKLWTAALRYVGINAGVVVVVVD